MNAQSLLASAGINIGLALVILSLFSLLKKQPSNAVVYLARRLSRQEPLPPFHPSLFTLPRLTPSFSWIPLAFRVSEESILHSSGLDALVLIRLLKFGIKFFSVCSVVGLFVLLPVNFTCPHGLSTTQLSRSMDSFTISNIARGSNRLWVHFCCLWFISFYGLCLLYQEYKGTLERRMQHLGNVRHRPDQFTVLVREIPVCTEHNTRGCCVDHFFSKHHPHSYQSYQMVYDGRDIEDLMQQASITADKIEHFQLRSVTEKHDRLFFIRRLLPKTWAQRERHEHKLQELRHKIRHLQGENMLIRKEVPAAFVSFKSRWGATIAAQTLQNEHPLLWITEVAPEPRDVLWDSLTIRYRQLAFYKIGVSIGVILFTLFFAIPVAAVQGLAEFERIKKWFPPARAVQLIPGLSSIVTGYLPSVVLNSFIYGVPYVMRALAGLEGFVSISGKEIKTCNMVFYFLVGNVFFLSLLSGSLLHQIGESFTHPRDFPSHLAAAVSAQADFFITYILTDGLSGFSLEILQPGLLIWRFIRAHFLCQGPIRSPYIYPMQFYRVIPFVSLAILIGMVYAVIAPLLLPFLVAYFFLGYVVYINQIQDVYDFVYDTCGQHWPHIHHFIFIAIMLMQITMIGLFGLKSKPAASIATIPVLFVTILFNEYCKIRFLPAFGNCSVQSAMEKDEQDEKYGLTDSTRENPIKAYRQPCLRPVNFMAREASSMQPLVEPIE